MTTAITNPDDIIDQMVALRLQQAKLNEQINTLKPQFFEACATQEASRFEHKQAVISRRLTPGKWDYPDHVVEQEESLKKLKRLFQETHEPIAGREVIWAIKLTD